MSERILPLIPHDRAVICESGIRGPDDVERLAPLGAGLPRRRDAAAPPRSAPRHRRDAARGDGPAGVTFVKFCGCMNPGDVEASVEAGADAVGLVFAPSPRRIDERMASEIARNLPARVAPIAVFANPTYDQIAFVRSIFEDPYIQLSGRESPGFVSWVGRRAIKTLHVEVRGEPEERLAKRGKRLAPRCCCSTRARARCLGAPASRLHGGR